VTTQAYAILAGGGTKAAALAGCLRAAEQFDIEFLGYGGVSGGSIIALLAAVGYKGNALRDLATGTPFTDYLPDGGDLLVELKGLVTSLGHVLAEKRDWLRLARLARVLFRHRKLRKHIHSKLGLYDGKKLEDVLLKLIFDRQQSLSTIWQHKRRIMFNDLDGLSGCKPLKVVASDLVRRCASVFSAIPGEDAPLISAVKASCAYPILAQPVRVFGSIYADGGFTCNLPVFLFEKDRDAYAKANNCGRPHIVAFQLIDENMSEPEDLASLLWAMIMTALEAGDEVLKGVIQGLVCVQVPIPSGPDGYSATDFDLDESDRCSLFDLGFRAATEQLAKARLPFGGGLPV